MILDEGAMRSFITTQCAQELDATSDENESEIINLAAFGGKSDTVRRIQNTILKLETINGRDLSLKLLIANKISTPVKTPNDPKIRDMPHIVPIRDKLAENPQSDYMEIDILIGADYYWSVIGDEIIRPLDDMIAPTAVSVTYFQVQPPQTKIEMLPPHPHLSPF
jgi:hypothetical protein